MSEFTYKLVLKNLTIKLYTFAGKNVVSLLLLN